MSTRTITAWQLCEKVIEHIRREPQNYYQSWWKVNTEDRAHHGLMTGRDCGTAYCIGGWMRHLMGHETMTQVSEALGFKFIDIAQNLFNGSALINSEDEKDMLKPGTVEYAEAGIAHLRSWMEENEQLLRAKQVRQVNN